MGGGRVRVRAGGGATRRRAGGGVAGASIMAPLAASMVHPDPRVASRNHPTHFTSHLDSRTSWQLALGRTSALNPRLPDRPPFAFPRDLHGCLSLP